MAFCIEGDLWGPNATVDGVQDYLYLTLHILRAVRPDEHHQIHQGCINSTYLAAILQSSCRYVNVAIEVLY